MRHYIIKTEKFGNVTVECDNVGQAMSWARKRFGVGPEGVSRRYSLTRVGKPKQAEAEAEVEAVDCKSCGAMTTNEVDGVFICEPCSELYSDAVLVGE